jgi:hypothetical protein
MNTKIGFPRTCFGRCKAEDENAAETKGSADGGDKGMGV